ncbi:MAG: AAA family ATPase [Alphaproteobacteria bacterium]|nr:AAA family ATPase [Alphaproteobacteria bacterium]
MDDKPYLRNVCIQWDKVEDKKAYPFCLTAVKNIESIKFKTPVTFIVGENGSGKSTVLEAIAAGMGINPEGGNKNTGFSTARTHSNLYEKIRCIKGCKRPRNWYFLRAESFYNVATYMDQVGYLDSYGGKSLHQQSHGESFMALLQNKLHGNGFYLFDEPEAALSPQRQLSALVHFQRLAQDSQLIIATHSPILMSYPGATIYLIGKDGIDCVDYQETEHYQVTKNFLNRTDAMLKTLLDDKRDFP